jgi:hypothetical protein
MLSSRHNLLKEEAVALLSPALQHSASGNSSVPNFVLPTLAIQKSEQKRVEEQAYENFSIRTITVILALAASVTQPTNEILQTQT